MIPSRKSESEVKPKVNLPRNGSKASDSSAYSSIDSSFGSEIVEESRNDEEKKDELSESGVEVKCDGEDDDNEERSSREDSQESKTDSSADSTVTLTVKSDLESSEVKDQGPSTLVFLTGPENASENCDSKIDLEDERPYECQTLSLVLDPEGNEVECSEAKVIWRCAGGPYLRKVRRRIKSKENLLGKERTSETTIMNIQHVQKRLCVFSHVYEGRSVMPL